SVWLRALRFFRFSRRAAAKRSFRSRAACFIVCGPNPRGGAGGENRTHDLPLTKGLRYHYATPANRLFGCFPGTEIAWRGPIAQGCIEGKARHLRDRSMTALPSQATSKADSNSTKKGCTADLEANTTYSGNTAPDAAKAAR